MNKRSFYIISIIVVFFLAIFLLLPLGHVIRNAFIVNSKFSFSFVFSLFTDKTKAGSLLISLQIAVAVTLFCSVIASLLSIIMGKIKLRGKAVFNLLLLVPIILPPFVGAQGMRMILARFGTLNLLLMNAGITDMPIHWLGASKFWAVVIVESLHFYPIIYLNMLAAITSIDQSREEAAYIFGAGKIKTFFKIILPDILPGFFSGAIIVFIGSFTELGTPLIFEMRNALPVMIFDRINEASVNPDGYAMVFIIVLLSFLLFISGKLYFRNKTRQQISKGTSHTYEIIVNSIIKVISICFIFMIFFLAFIPHISVILTGLSDKWFMTPFPESYTLDHLRTALFHPLLNSGIKNSMIMSGIALLITVVMGFLISYICVRRKIGFAVLLDAAAMLPLAIPGIVIAFGYIEVFQSIPRITGIKALESFLDPKVNPTFLLIMSYTIRRLPYMVRVTSAGLEMLGNAVEEAALMLGASMMKLFRKIVIPLLRTSIIAGCILTFSFLMLEVSDSIILAMNEKYYPITKAMYTVMANVTDGGPVSSVFGIWLMMFLGASILTASLYLGKKIGDMFRM
jgi:iron(III) transport system permease protein